MTDSNNRNKEIFITYIYLSATSQSAFCWLVWQTGWFSLFIICKDQNLHCHTCGPAIPHAFRVRLQQLPSLMWDRRLRLLNYFQNTFALIAYICYHWEKNCPISEVPLPYLLISLNCPPPRMAGLHTCKCISMYIWCISPPFFLMSWHHHIFELQRPKIAFLLPFWQSISTSENYDLFPWFPACFCETKDRIQGRSTIMNCYYFCCAPMQ